MMSGGGVPDGCSGYFLYDLDNRARFCPVGGEWGLDLFRRRGLASLLGLMLLSLPGVAQASPVPGPEAGPVPALESAAGIRGDSPQATLEALRNPAPPGPRAGRSGLCAGTAFNGGCWADGVAKQFTPPDCNYFQGTGLATAYTGYWIGDDGGYPAKGDIYWGHVVASYGVLACTVVTSIEALLPPNTEFALDGSVPENQGRIRCFLTYTNGTTGRTYDFTGASTQNDDCYEQPGSGIAGSTLGYATMTSTLDEWTVFEIVFPLTSKAPLNGIASSRDKLGSRVAFTYDALFPETWVTVRQAGLTLRPRRKGSKILAAGTLSPSSTVRANIAAAGFGPKISVSFRGLRGRRMISLGTKSVNPSPTGGFSVTFGRRARTKKCQVVASWAGVTTARKPVAC